MASLSSCQKHHMLTDILGSGYDEILHTISDQRTPIRLIGEVDGRDTKLLSYKDRFLTGKLVRELRKVEANLDLVHELRVEIPFMRRSLNLQKTVSMFSYYSKCNQLRTRVVNLVDQSNEIDELIGVRCDTHTTTFSTHKIIEQFEHTIQSVKIQSPFSEHVNMNLCGIELRLPVNNHTTTQTLLSDIVSAMWCVSIATIPLSAHRDYMKFILKGGYYGCEERF